MHPIDPATKTPGRSVVDAVLERRRPDRFAYGPNYWQWFAHQVNRGLPPELAGYDDQIELIRGLGLDVFSRNVYSDQQRGWIGGLSEAVYDEVEFTEKETRDGLDRIYHRTYRTPKGTLTERLRYVWAESTLVQEEFLLDEPLDQLDAFEALVHDRRFRFLVDDFRRWEDRAGEDGRVIVGELYSPLKLLHFAMDPVQTCYLLLDAPEQTARIMAAHEVAMLDLAEQIGHGGARAMMSMDNLDTMFHTPRYVEQCSASFYEKAARIGREHACPLMIHACGSQRANLPLIGSLGVDGLEGVAFPTLGDVELDEAMQLSGDRMILTGGISAMEYERLKTREDIFAYTRDLFQRMEPYAHRFVFAASCTTPYSAPWEKLVAFRDAWLEYGGL